MSDPYLNQTDSRRVVTRRTLRCAAVTFETTHWSLVVAAGGDDSSAARTALATLCETYWYPLYAYVRRWGVSACTARSALNGEGVSATGTP